MPPAVSLVWLFPALSHLHIKALATALTPTSPQNTSNPPKPPIISGGGRLSVPPAVPLVRATFGRRPLVQRRLPPTKVHPQPLCTPPLSYTLSPLHTCLLLGPLPHPFTPGYVPSVAFGSASTRDYSGARLTDSLTTPAAVTPQCIHPRTLARPGYCFAATPVALGCFCFVIPLASARATQWRGMLPCLALSRLAILMPSLCQCSLMLLCLLTPLCLGILLLFFLAPDAFQPSHSSVYVQASSHLRRNSWCLS